MTVQPATGSRKARQQAGSGILRLLLPLMLVLFISNLDSTIVATAIPAIGRSLRDTSGGPWIATALFGTILAHALGGGNTLHAYRVVFSWTIPFMALALILALVMPEKPLSEEMVQ
ncbi:MAG TPA: hypothetical protein VHZ03_13785 [Trebonia sp.]|jgi:hypothetical protein|nr:hypothetical protein [Trebonia sp.]